MIRFRRSIVRRPATGRAAGLILVAGLAGFAVVQGAAHEGATGIVKERMDAMKAMGADMKAVAAMMRGEAPYDAARVRSLAGEIGAHGGDATTRLFPVGSLHTPTRALPAIWSDWDRFSAMADRMTDYAAALAAAAGNARAQDGGAEGASNAATNGTELVDLDLLSAMPPDVVFRLLAKSCAECHNRFREEKK